jgi:peptidoglycan/xylan/chitin deacetylase (PgdA/CDA1 family)
LCGITIGVLAAASRSPAARGFPTERPPPGVLTRLPGNGNQLALTIDDGASAQVVGAFADFCRDSGTRLTFVVNAANSSWSVNAPALRPMVDSGQVQLGNRTWSHPDITRIAPGAVADQIRRNAARRVDGRRDKCGCGNDIALQRRTSAVRAPIARFQAVQAHLVTHQQAAVVASAIDGAVAAVELGRGSFEIACAKMLADHAGQLVTAAAHQTHGAIGMTKEYPLHYLTRRLWAWRDKAGGHHRWADRLGAALGACGPDALYPAIQSGSEVMQ